MISHLYVLGTDPYENSHREYGGNGEWNVEAPNLEEALKVIFSSIPFPAEPVGRKFFLEGISLAGVHEEEIIQVWSTEPEVVKRTQAVVKNYKTAGLHNGRDRDFGLHAEIKVTDIDKYLAPVRGLLAAPAIEPGIEHTELSPMGASLIKFSEMKHELTEAMQRERMEITKREWEMEKLSNVLDSKMKNMEDQIKVLNTYLHGTRHKTQISRGKRASGRYVVYQNRQYLSEELALLANLESFDFEKMEQMEKWLIKSGRVWKFLPFERCILATRICKDKKDYGDPLVSLYKNYENMRNMVWIRDGENVFHVDVEYEFNNAVFPDKNQFERALQVVQNHVWKKAFRWKHPANWHGQPLKAGEYDNMGQMRRKPLEELEPYCTQKNERARFRSMDAWLRSELYTELLDKQMKNAVHDYLAEVNRKQMVFAVLLQGIVDNTNFLDIPKGSDLFNPEVIEKYFDLVSDYTHAIGWKGISDKIAPYLDQKSVTKGEWIVVPDLEEYIEGASSYSSGTTYSESHAILFKVIDFEEVTIHRHIEEEEAWRDVKEIKPVVNYHPRMRKRSRRTQELDYWDASKTRTKSPKRLVLKSSSFIRVPMSPSLAEQILDDREWKKKNKWLVPLMVNYKLVIKAVKAGINATIIRWEKNDD